jgi:hypothetical protein
VETTIQALAKKDDISAVRKRILEAKEDIIRWMFIFWIGQIGTTLAIMFFFLKK